MGPTISTSLRDMPDAVFIEVYKTDYSGCVSR